MATAPRPKPSMNNMPYDSSKPAKKNNMPYDSSKPARLTPASARGSKSPAPQPRSPAPMGLPQRKSVGLGAKPSKGKTYYPAPSKARYAVVRPTSTAQKPSRRTDRGTSGGGGSY